MNTFKSINWKDAKELCSNGSLNCSGTNFSNIHPSGEYSISADGSRLYKLRLLGSGFTYDLIAKK